MDNLLFAPYILRVRLKPTNDLVFKLLFVANPYLLKDMLEAVLEPATPFAVLEVLDPELPGDLTGDKAIRLDVRARSLDGSVVDVEMQAQGRQAFPPRMLFYWARNYTEPLGRGEAIGALPERSFSDPRATVALPRQRSRGLPEAAALGTVSVSLHRC